MSMDFGIRCVQTFLFLTELVLPGIWACVVSLIQLFDAAECGNLFSRVFPGACFSTGLARVFISAAYSHVLVNAVLIQIYSTMFVISFATHRRIGFRARAKAILAGLRKQTVPATFVCFKAVATVLGFVALIPTAFRLLHALGKVDLPLMLVQLGIGAGCLGGKVFFAVCCRRILADASNSGFGARCGRFTLVGAGMFCKAAAIVALFYGAFLPVAVLMAAHPSQALAAAAAVIAVLSTVDVLILLVQPVIYPVLWDKYHSV